MQLSFSFLNMALHNDICIKFNPSAFLSVSTFTLFIKYLKQFKLPYKAAY